MTSFKETWGAARGRHLKPKIPQSIEELKRQQRLIELSRKFREVGESWREILDTDSNSSGAVRKDWQALLPQFASSSENERLSILNWFANGLGISEERPEDLDAYSLYPLDSYQKMNRGKTFSLASMLILEVVSDISGSTENQKRSLVNSLESSTINREDIKGQVKLNHIFPGIAQFIVRQFENSRQSPRLS